MLCNVALHGLEVAINQAAPRKYRAIVIRYADDLVILCVDLETLIRLKDTAEEWLATVDLRLKPSKTRITHTLNEHEGNVGFDFLGFNVRESVRRYRGTFRRLDHPGKPRPDGP